MLDFCTNPLSTGLNIVVGTTVASVLIPEGRGRS